MFNAVVIHKDDEGYRADVEQLDESVLMDGDVTVSVEWSTLNYKDGLAICGKAPIVRAFPMVPGIDFAGTVTASHHDLWKIGDKVILNGWGVGESHFGGLAQTAQVNGDWLVALPEGLSTEEAMCIGTAGYTAMLSVQALEEQGVTPDQGEILVTGANGGVGSLSIALLAKNGFNVVASTGRVNESEHLKKLGASDVIDRAELSAPGKPLARERWAGVIDCVGSHTLANALASCKRNGVVAACGLAQGMDLPASVAPFILRGVTLRGIDSVYATQERREKAWQALAGDLDLSLLHDNTRQIGLNDVIQTAKDLLAGTVRGRVVVDVNS